MLHGPGPTGKAAPEPRGQSGVCVWGAVSLFISLSGRERMAFSHNDKAKLYTILDVVACACNPSILEAEAGALS